MLADVRAAHVQRQAKLAAAGAAVEGDHAALQAAMQAAAAAAVHAAGGG